MNETISGQKSSESLSLSGFVNPISTPKPLFFPSSSSSPTQNFQLQSARSKFQLQHLHSLLPCAPLTLSLPQNLSSMVQFNNPLNNQLPSSARHITIPTTVAGYHSQLTSLQLLALKNSTHPYLPSGHSLHGCDVFSKVSNNIHNNNNVISDPHSQPPQSPPLAVHSFEVVPSKLEMLKSKRRKLQASLTNDHIQQVLNKIDSIHQNDNQHSSRSVRLDSPSTSSYGSCNNGYFSGFTNDSQSQMQKQYNSKDFCDNTSIFRETASNPLENKNEVFHNRSNKGIILGLPLQLTFEENGIQKPVPSYDRFGKITQEKVEKEDLIDSIKKKTDKQQRQLEPNKSYTFENPSSKGTTNYSLYNKPEESESVAKLKREMLQLIQENLRLKKAAYLAQQKYSSLQEKYEITEMKYQAALNHTNTFNLNTTSANTATTTSRQGIAPSCSFSSLIVQQEDRSSMVLPCIITRSNAVTPISSLNQHQLSSFQQQSSMMEDTTEDNNYSYKKQKFIQIHRLIDDNQAGGVIKGVVGKTEEVSAGANSKIISSFSLESNKIILHS